jgi:hypothetical protein
MYLLRGYMLYRLVITWLCVTSYSQPQTNKEYIISGTNSPVTNLTHDPIGLIILITSWLTSNYFLSFSYLNEHNYDAKPIPKEHLLPGYFDQHKFQALVGDKL